MVIQHQQPVLWPFIQNSMGELVPESTQALSLWLLLCLHFPSFWTLKVLCFGIVRPSVHVCLAGGIFGPRVF